MCQGYCGKREYTYCAACMVIEDTLRERGIDLEALGSLASGLSENPQKWSMKDIIAAPVVIDTGEDEPNFTWVLGFSDGRWAAVRGWHDYTGWDCQSGLTTEWYPTQERAMATLVDWERETCAKLGIAVLT